MKLERYRLFGVPTYWVVDPVERRVLVWDFAAGASAAEVVETGERLAWKPAEGVTLDIDPE